MDSSLKINNNSIYNLRKDKKKYNRKEKSRTSPVVKSCIDIILDELKKNQRLEDLRFTTKLFDNHGLFLVSSFNKIVIVLFYERDYSNDHFYRHCDKKSYKSFTHIIGDPTIKICEEINNFLEQLGLWITNRAKELNEEEIESEEWFKEKFIKERIYDLLQVEYNKPIRRFIYDVYCKKYNFVIEIDGSIHDKQFQKEKDLDKDRLSSKYGLHVYRVKAYNDESYHKVIDKISSRIKREYKKNFKDSLDHFKPKLGNVILRKNS